MAVIGFIGLGNMGAPMAANLVKAGHRVTGYDISASALQALASAGVHAAGSAAEAARGADVVITMLPAGEHVRDVWLHQGGLIDVVRDAKPLLIDCSTIDVDSARTVSEAASVAGLEMLDAPVSGGVGGATAATLTFMVGGSDTAFARGLPVLQAMGKNIVLAGGPGAGQAAKICNNMMLAINMVGVSEGFLLARKLGLDWDKLFQIASTSSGQSWALSNYCPAPGPVPAAPSNRDYAAGFMAALMLKDVKLSQAAADVVGSPTPLAKQAMSFYQAVVDAGDGAKDFSVVFRWLAAQQR
ncbi:MAG TPA: 3-hydroxyisobutyrate dehydrogenase [Acetobacteraceae bacterium]|nr:3-hydroxyisobutyrate dehydrogenase [Acetobacteraceae bacterium]